MGEQGPEPANISFVSIGLALEDYELSRTSGSDYIRGEAHKRFLERREVMTPEEQSLLANKILDFERPETKDTGPPPEQMTSENPELVRLAKMVDDRQAIDAAEKIIKQSEQTQDKEE